MEMINAEESFPNVTVSLMLLKSNLNWMWKDIFLHSDGGFDNSLTSTVCYCPSYKPLVTLLSQ